MHRLCASDDIIHPMVKSQTPQDDAFYDILKNHLANVKSDEALFEAIVNAPFHHRLESTLLGLGIIVFMLVDEQTGTIDRIALSQTEQAAEAVKYSVKPFREIKIPMDHQDNIIAKAIREQQPQQSADWQYFFIPALTSEEAHINQAGAGVGYSVVHPFHVGERRGAITYSYYLYPEDMGAPQEKFMHTYSNMVREALKNSARLT